MTNTHWASWRDLSNSDRALLLLLATLQPLISASLNISGFAKTRQRLESLIRRAPQRDANPSDLAYGDRLARLAGIAGRHGPVQTTCLRQSLAIYFLLLRKGLRPVIQLGMLPESKQTSMHAWVELDGIVLGRSNTSYVPFTAAEQKARDTSSKVDGS